MSAGAPRGRGPAFGALADRAEEVLSMRRDPRPWIEQSLLIRTKDRRLVPFQFNEAQTYYYQNRSARDIIVKPRQLGFTTQVCGLFFADTILRPNTTSVMVAHDLESTKLIFRIVQLFWEFLPPAVKQRVGPPSRSNRREFLWPGTNSYFGVGTAGALTYGRGMTIHNLHCSEFGYWPKPEEALVALLEAVPEQGRVVIESTPNGMGNYLHDLWLEALEGRGRFRPQFFVWWENPAYAIPGPALSDLTEEERVLQARYQLSDDQLRWRRAKQADLGEKFRQEYPSDPYTCFLASGRCLFDADALVAIQAEITAGPPPQEIATLRAGDGAGLSLAPARLLVWRQPQPGRTYVIGADVGEGLADGDASCAVVLDRLSGEQVAELHGRVSPERFARLLDALGRWYQRAQIGVERNNHGHSTLNTLRNVCRYPDLYYYVAYDSGHGRPREVQLGWPTNAATKPILVDDLAEAINGRHLKVRSAGLVAECFTFVLTDTGSAEAQPGKHDDRVMAAGIAWQVRKRPRPRMSSERPAGM